FCFPENIDAQSTKLFSGLKAADFLRNLSADQFAAKAAHFLSELNAIHAFREGNGRAQLTFFALLADRAGHRLNIEKLDPEVMLDAMIASFDGDQSQLTKVIAGLIASRPGVEAFPPQCYASRMTIRLHRGDLPDLARYTGAVAVDTETMG